MTKEAAGAAATSTGAAGTTTDDKGAAAGAAGATEQAATEKAAADKVAADAAAKAVADKTAADDAAKAEAGKKAGDEGKGKEPESKAGETPKAPEKYELTTPKGADDYITPDVRTRIEALARANNLDNDAAQGLLQEHVSLMHAQSEAFLAELKADKTYGGDNLAATQQLARAAIDKIRPVGHPGRESFLRFLNAGGAGNQRDVVAFLADIGKSMAEDSPTAARGSGNETGSQAEKLYDNPASKALHGQS